MYNNKTQHKYTQQIRLNVLNNNDIKGTSILKTSTQSRFI